jgi:hypothetical protein
MTDERLAEIETRALAATNGPWRVDHESWKEVNDITVWYGEGDEAQCVCNMGAAITAVDNRAEAEVSYANGTFVAHAREDVPALLSEVRRLRAVNADLLAARDEAANRLHSLAMNVPCDDSRTPAIVRLTYKVGHRDARHAIAEAISAYFAEAPR